MTAFIFPGQGSQHAGMGKDLYENSIAARRIFDNADAILGFSLSTMCFEGTDEQLRQTDITQPALFVHSAAVLSELNESPTIVAGHSLGEYSAIFAAGALDFEDALRLVRLRGKLMLQCGIEQSGTMAAIIGLDEQTVDALCVDASEAGVAQAANYNAPGQIVISGSVAGVHTAMQLAKQKGARLVKELNVSGAFHSPLMQSAQQGLGAAIEQTTFRDAAIPVVANVTALPVTQAGEIKMLLLQQLTRPVRWSNPLIRWHHEAWMSLSKLARGMFYKVWLNV